MIDELRRDIEQIKQRASLMDASTTDCIKRLAASGEKLTLAITEVAMGVSELSRRVDALEERIEQPDLRERR